MNTRIEYMYRDGANNKQWHTVIIAGTLTKDQLTPYLEQGRYFIPSQVGLDDLPGRLHRVDSGSRPCLA